MIAIFKGQRLLQKKQTVAQTDQLTLTLTGTVPSETSSVWCWKLMENKVGGACSLDEDRSGDVLPNSDPRTRVLWVPARMEQPFLLPLICLEVQFTPS